MAASNESYFIKNKQTIATTAKILRRKITDLENHSYHFLDLMYGNVHYKPLQKISWNKRPDQLFEQLSNHEAIIQDSLSGKELITATPVHSEDFLVINKNLKWVLIESNFCPYEEEIMGHCATAPRHCRLLSLRELSNKWPRLDRKTQKWREVNIKTPQWLSRVTATICPETSSEKSPMYGKFYVTEILGPKNEKVNPKWYKAIQALYDHSSIVEQKSGSYNAFMTSDLALEDQEALYKKKPSLAPPTWAVEKATDKELGGLFLKFLDESYEPDSIKASLASLYYETAETVCLFKFKDTEMFFERISDFLSKKHGDVLKGIVEAYTQPWTWTESMDFSSQWHNSSIDEFIAEMSDTQFRKAFGNIKRDSYTRQDISADLGDIINQVIRDVSEDSYAIAISRTALAVLKDATFQDVGERETAYINFHKGVWKFLISTEALRRSLITSIDREEPLTHYMLSNFSISGPEDWNIAYEFDEAAALEKFKELVLEMYGP